MAWWVWVLIGLGVVVLFFVAAASFGSGRNIVRFGLATARRNDRLEVGTTARIEGTIVAADEVLQGPATGRDVVAYRVTCRLGDVGDRGSEVVTVDERAVDFALDDGHGRVLVRATDPTLLLEPEDEMRFPTDDAPDWVVELAARAGVDRSWGGTYCVRELALEPGERAGAMGMVAAGPVSWPFELVGTDDQELFITDQPSMLK